jgi:endonuclease YncB( thermonuclease family)
MGARGRKPRVLAPGVLLLLLLGLLVALARAPHLLRRPAEPPPAESVGERPPVGSVVEGRVTHVPDGDSLRVRVGTREYSVRLYGIDAPEGNTRQPYADEARDYARRLAEGKTVRLFVRDHDRFGRVVAEATLPDGANVGHAMVEAGLAWHYTAFAKSDERLAALQAGARQARRGLWSDPNPTAPWEWRKRHRPAPRG